jgi:purine-cytosine permease-like protein
MWWTALGGFLPAVALSGLGVLAGTVVDMTNPQTSLRVLLPGWFYPVFLLVIVAGAITNNVLTAYSTGLALQAVGIPWQRSVAEQHPRADGCVSGAGARDLRNRQPAQAQPLRRA